MSEFCGHASSATHKQTGWVLHQRRWSNDACATLQRRPHHELAWIWTNFLSAQPGDWFRRDSSRAGGKQQPAQCLRKTQDKFTIASMAKKLLHCYIGEHHACAGVYIRQALWTSVYTFAYTLATGCAYAPMYVQFFIQRWGTRVGGSN